MHTRRYILFLLLIFITYCAAGSYGDIFATPEKYDTYLNKTLIDMLPQLEENLNNPEFLYNYAWRAREEGDMETSATYIEKAVTLRPKNPFLHFKAGQIYLVKGDNQKAQYHFEQALENHYEYTDAWFELIKLAPEYYYNFAMLFGEKAHQTSRSDLADQAISYYNDYLTNNSPGEFEDAAGAGIKDMELLKSEIAGRTRVRQRREEQQREIAGQKLERKREMEQFRTTRKRFIGLFFNTFSPLENYEYTISDEKKNDCITQRIYLKDIPGGYHKQDYDTVDGLGATSLSEFGVSGGFFSGPFILRGNLIFGMSNLNRNYLQDTTVSKVDTFYQDTITTDTGMVVIDSLRLVPTIRTWNNPITSVNTVRLSAEGLYNFYYASPLLLYISAGADIGYIYLSEKESYFNSVFIGGFGIGGGVLLRFGNLIVDIGYRRNLIGSSSGGLIIIGGMYKF